MSKRKQKYYTDTRQHVVDRKGNEWVHHYDTMFANKQYSSYGVTYPEGLVIRNIYDIFKLKEGEYNE